jgi:hypothetical protein
MNFGGVVAPAILVLVANVWVLVGVARNRAGRPDAELELTERELRLVRLGEENSGVALDLEWEGPRPRPPDAPAGWFDEAKLRELGFDPGQFSRASLPKDAFVVLEYQARSGLVAVDAGRDPAALRRRYPGRGRHIIMRAMVNLFGGPKPRQVRGVILPDPIPQIHVPLPLNRTLAGLSPSPPGPLQPRYAVTLRFGRNYEPWITSCRRIQQ